MAEEQAQATQPAAAAPAAPPARELPFADQMRAIDPKVFDPDTPTHPEAAATEAAAATEPAAEEKPAKGKAAAAKKQVIEVPADATQAEIEQIKALAAKHGFHVEDGKITTGERVRLRQEAQARQRMLEEREREAQQKIEEATKQFEDRFRFADEVSEFQKTRDFQKLAKSLGFETWDKLQEEVIAQNTDPNYRRIRELEEYKNREERAKQERMQLEQQRAQESARVEAQQRYMTKLHSDMAASKDPLVQAMADDPSFANAIFQIQREHYNPADDTTVTPEQAALMAVRGAAKPVKTELEQLYKRLHKVFGAQEPKPEPAAGTLAKPKPKTEALPAPRASKVTKHDPGTRDWMKYAEEQLRQASEEDHRRELANRGARS